jgi:hypothetical protein
MEFNRLGKISSIDALQMILFNLRIMFIFYGYTKYY